VAKYLLIDTSVWLTLAEDPTLTKVLGDLATILDQNLAQLLVPAITLDEFERNRSAIAGRAEKQFQSAASKARSVVQLLSAEDREVLESLLKRAEKRVSADSELAASKLQTVKRLLTAPAVVKLVPPDHTRLRALDRALSKKAPFHKEKNSAADALILESFRDFVTSSIKPQDEAAFVTMNKRDFSDPKDERLPHPDFSDLFLSPDRRYAINLAEVLAGIQPAKNWSEEIAAYARAAARDTVCLFGGEHDFRDGAYLRSAYGGLTWQEWCSKCQTLRDTGDPWD